MILLDRCQHIVHLLVVCDIAWDRDRVGVSGCLLQLFRIPPADDHGCTPVFELLGDAQANTRATSSDQ